MLRNVSGEIRCGSVVLQLGPAVCRGRLAAAADLDAEAPSGDELVQDPVESDAVRLVTEPLPDVVAVEHLRELWQRRFDIRVDLAEPPSHGVGRHGIGDRDGKGSRGRRGDRLSREAHRIGLVDEVHPLDGVVERAIDWANGMIVLPPNAMSQTRKAARADLVRIMEEGLATERELLVNNWFSDETQTSLRAIVARMKKK